MRRNILERTAEEVNGGVSRAPLGDPRWGEKKRQSRVLFERFAGEVQEAGLLDEYAGRLARMGKCSETLVFAECPECGRRGVVMANFCRDRLCPMCAWRLSLRRYAENLPVFLRMEEMGYLPVFLTLSIRNVPAEGEALRRGASGILSAFKTLVNKYLEGLHVGYYRVLEVTYNERRREFHPHVHAIFWTKDGRLLPKYRLTELWRKALRVDYLPVNYVQRVRGSGTRGELGKYLCKYTVKFTDVEGMPLLALAEGMKGVRTVGYGGLVREIRKEVSPREDVVQEVRDGEVVILCPSHLVPMVERLYGWTGCEYVS